MLCVEPNEIRFGIRMSVAVWKSMVMRKTLRATCATNNANRWYLFIARCYRISRYATGVLGPIVREV